MPRLEERAGDLVDDARLSPAVGQSRTHLDLDGRKADGFVAPLEPERDAVVVRTAEQMLNREASLDLALTRLVRRTIGGRFRLRPVAPVPFDGGAVELLEVVGAADDLGGQHHARGRHADDGLGLQSYLRTFAVRGIFRVLPISLCRRR